MSCEGDCEPAIWVKEGIQNLKSELKEAGEKVKRIHELNKIYEVEINKLKEKSEKHERKILRLEEKYHKIANEKKYWRDQLRLSQSFANQLKEELTKVEKEKCNAMKKDTT